MRRSPFLVLLMTLFFAGALFVMQEDVHAADDVINRTWVTYTDNGDGTCSIDKFLYKANVSPTHIIIPRTLEIEEDKDGDGNRDVLVIKKIADQAFAGAGLASVKFSDDCEVEEIAFQAFYNDQLSSLKLPATVKTLGREAFSGALGIGVLDLSALTELKDIPYRAFYDGGLTDLILPPNLEKIGAAAFTGNNIDNKSCGPGDPGYNKIVIPETVTEIGAGAFNNRKAFIDMSSHAPGSVAGSPWVSGSAVSGWKVIWDDSNMDPDESLPFMFDKSGWIYGLKDDLNDKNKNYSFYDKNKKTLTIPKTINRIPVKGFTDYGLGNTSTATIGVINHIEFADDSGITTLPESLFRNMNCLKSVTLSQSVKEIKKEAFRGNNIENFDFKYIQKIDAGAIVGGSPKTIQIGSDVTSIDKAAFPNLPSLTDIDIKKTIDTIPDAPWGATYAKVTWLNGTTEPAELETTQDGKWLFDTSTKTIHTYIGDYEEGMDLEVPGQVVVGSTTYDVETVGVSTHNILSRQGASLGKITICDGIKTIYGAFSGIALESVDFSENTTLETIQYYAFYNCGLTDIKIPESVTYLGGLGNNNFVGQMVIPRNVVKIEQSTFVGCVRINSIKVEQYYNKRDDDLYPVASNEVTARKPYGATAAGTNVFFMDQAQPVPSHEITVDPEQNQVKIKYTVYTNTITDIVKKIDNGEGMPQVFPDGAAPTTNGEENPYLAHMDISSKTANGIQGGNGTYTVLIGFGHQAVPTDVTDIQYNVKIDKFHSITYNANPAGMYISGSAPQVNDVFVEGFEHEVLDPTQRIDPLKIAGYKFTEWNTSPDGEGDSYEPGDTLTMPGEDVTLYAQWEEVPVNITLDANGGNFEHGPQISIVGRYMQPLREVQGYAVPERDAHTFLGWATENDATEADTVDVPENDRTLYAVWGKNIVTLTFDANGGRIDGSGAYTVSGFPGNAVIAPEAIRQGYIHKGWTTDKAGEDPVTVSQIPNRTMTYYAKWEADGITVHFADGEHGHSPTAAANVPSGGKVGVVPTAEPDPGYIFTNKWVSSEGGVYESEEIAGYLVTGDNNPVTFTPQYVEEGKSLIIYDYNGGVLDDKGLMIYTGDAGSRFEPGDLPVPVKTGYEHRWDAEAPSRFPAAGEVTMRKAVWRPVTNRVIFAADEGGTTDTESVSVESGKTVGVVPEATALEGFRFKGLWKSSEGGFFSPEQVKDYVVTGANQQVTFTAQFEEKNKSTILFFFDGGTHNGSGFISYTGVAESEFTENVPVPERTGWKFEGWDQEPTLYPAVGVVTTVTAEWTAKENTVKFAVPDGGELVDTLEEIKVNTGQKVDVAPVAEAQDGYTFDGKWECSEGGIFTKEQIAEYVISGKNEEVTFTALITEIPKFTVYFDAGLAGTVTPEMVQVREGMPVGVTPLFTPNEGYSFKGEWRLSTGGRYETSEIAGYTVGGSEKTLTFTAICHAHDFGDPEYTWADDNSICTAVRKCRSDGCNEKEEEARPASSEVTKQPSCTGKGETTYTAKFDNKAFTDQDKTEQNIDPLGHDFGEWKHTKAPTTEAEGEETRECNRCGEKEKRSVKKLDPAPGPDPDPTPDPDDDTSSPWTGKSEEEVEKIITGSNSEEPAGSTFGMLRASGIAKGKNSLLFKWTKVKGVNKIVIYANECGKTKRFKKEKTLKGGVKKYVPKKIRGKKLKKGKYYKFIVVAFDKNGKTIAVSKTIHVATNGGKRGNDKAVKLKKPTKAKLTLKRKKTHSIKAKEVKGKLKVSRHRKLAYESTNKKVATVTKKGKIRAVGKGKCTIYVYAQNGVYKTIKITVK